MEHTPKPWNYGQSSDEVLNKINAAIAKARDE